VEIAALDDQAIEEGDLEVALSAFDPHWNEIFSEEKRRLLWLLIEEVSYNAQQSEIKITFRASGIRALAEERRRKEAV